MPLSHDSTRIFRLLDAYALMAVLAFAGCNDASSVTTPPPPPPPEPTVLTITTASPITGTVNAPFNVQLTAVAGTPPFIWTIIGNQPPGPGLTLNSSTGVISGTPTSVSSTTRNYLVIDSTTPTAQTAEASLTITINAASPAPLGAVGPLGTVDPSPPTIAPFVLPPGTVNVAYPTIRLEATGGTPPYTWSVNPALPSGLSLNVLGPGIMSGTPLNASPRPTEHTFTVVDSTAPTAKVGAITRLMTVHAALTIDTNSPTAPPLPSGTVGRPYEATLSASGGKGPETYVWSIVGAMAPAPGLLLNSDGTIRGVPVAAGSFERAYLVQDNTGTVAMKSLKLVVNAALTIDHDATTWPLPTGIVGQPYRATLSASGGTGPGTYQWNLAAESAVLPDGLALNADGTISGLPTTAGTSSLILIVRDAASAYVRRPLRLTIAP